MSVRCHYYFPQQSWNSNMNMSVEQSQSFQSGKKKKFYLPRFHLQKKPLDYLKNGNALFRYSKNSGIKGLKKILMAFLQLHVHTIHQNY